MQFDQKTPFISPADVAKAGGLGRLVERARQLEALDQKLRCCLAPPLSQHCRLANIREDRLVFMASSANWASKLRMQTAQLLAAAASLGLDVRSVTVKVATMPSADAVATPKTPLSPAARDALRAAAESTSDPLLRERLIALASLADS